MQTSSYIPKLRQHMYLQGLEQNYEKSKTSSPWYKKLSHSSMTSWEWKKNWECKLRHISQNFVSICIC